MKTIKDEFIAIRVSKSTKDGIKKRAKAEKVSLSKFVVKAMLFNLAFPHGFLERISEIADRVELLDAVVISNLLQFYLARDAAFVKVFPGKLPTWNAAFRRDDSGQIITDDRLGDMIFSEMGKKFSDLRKQMEADEAAGRTTVVDHESLSLLQAAI